MQTRENSPVTAPLRKGSGAVTGGRPAIAGLILFISFVILAPTLTIPFFVIDDSDLITHATKYGSLWDPGNLHKLFDRSMSGARFWPGFGLYAVLRETVFGTDSVLWHAWQILLYAICGTILTAAGKKLTGSHLPGIAAYVLLLCTGSVDYQSNWFNYVFTNSFEPFLLLLWTCGAAFLYAAYSSRNSPLSHVWSCAACILLAWSVTAKETSGATLLLVIIPLLLLLWRRPGALGVKGTAGRLMIPLGIVALFSAIWVVVVLATLPSGTDYAGSSTFVKNPWKWLVAFTNYMSSWYACSHILIPLALAHYLIRISAMRSPRDLWQGLLPIASLAQVAPLLVWPEVSMRLSQPAYAMALLFSCCEFFRLLTDLSTMHPAGERTHRSVVFLTATGILFLGGRLLPGRWHVGIVQILFVCWVGFGVFQNYIGYSGGVIHRWTRNCWITILAILGILVTALCVTNLSSYMTEYRLREGVRHRASEYISREAVKSARVVWLVPKEAEIFAWSSGIYVRLFHSRHDLEVAPLSAIRNRTLRKDDLIVAYGPDTVRAPKGAGNLSRTWINDGGREFSVRSPAQWHTLFVEAMTPPFRKPEVRLKEFNTQIAVYRVQSEKFELR